ncbi:chymotrypsin-like protease CTRL-1 isoform X2 [Cimex lectularius]|uniref:Phenoloxidase-activating factor 2 n=1 Tax=Cimex lectularius TaxID=79782 RepID=A0A8I6SSE7_CIMLE|nr:chymotrypsin-like protease CTRL-1 isoform X2 [Cimex lectularius]
MGQKSPRLLLCVCLILFAAKIHQGLALTITDGVKQYQARNPVYSKLSPKLINLAPQDTKYWEIAAKEDYEESVHKGPLDDLLTVREDKAHSVEHKPEFQDLLLPSNGLAKKCNMTSNEKISCVGIKECKTGQINQNKKNGTYCQRSNGEIGVCCPEIGRTRPKRQTSNSINIVEETKEASRNLDLSKLGDTSNCGFSSKSLPKEMKKHLANIRDYPWIIAVMTHDLYHYCGGVLISQRHIITAAHCVPNVRPEKILIRLGEYDFNRVNDSKTVDVSVESIQSHEEFDGSTYENDIALITLKEKASYDEYVHPICLPMPNDTNYKVNQTTIVAGWGSTEYGGIMNDLLMAVAVPIWDQEQCSSSFSQTVFDTMMCVGGYEGGKDSCQGDSGGPLITQREDGRWVSLGVVSWGIGCGTKGKPGVYTRVNQYLDWIASHLN